MATLDELKMKWGESGGALPAPEGMAPESFEKIVRTRVKKHTNTAVQYFWAAFALQILVYALLGHVVAKYWSDTQAVLTALVGVALYIPFTVVLMRRFKAIARTNVAKTEGGSLQESIRLQHDNLQQFYKFKRQYEWILIPVSSAIGVFLVFRIWVPGGVQAHWMGVGIALAITLVSCGVAIFAENKRNFEAPLGQLKEVLEEFKAENE
ncbi:hypothetical protein RT717_21720 [Imperialibacter roseus]|uniref:Uncharacterized protein n=1 Tax=Imperialibacter roseus TaxID=1324217 RepID=A0ABZ0IKZ4_9BACT|nr:hypothetical protein [Imperialibacter roseus]WOK05698.1 hypothetical protein RT717_21720 [Imperialibacter roseus]